ncbi:hypothetical protein EDB84DRAFT_339956 [Lactarius hengduanensis]|nr:hypothetical protein EDB84DRAFT_339956 [Lactarius hengduanensis]
MAMYAFTRPLFVALTSSPRTLAASGRNMGDSPMVVGWPSRGADGEYNSVALSQCKAPYEVMPTPDRHPPFTAKFSITDTYVTVENPQIAFTLGMPRRTGCRTSFGRSVARPRDRMTRVPPSRYTTRSVATCPTCLTRIPTIPAEPPVPLLPPPPVHIEHPHPHPEEEDENHDDENAEDEDESHDDDDDAAGSGSASFVHGALCTVGFLLVLPSSALMARCAKATGSPRAFLCTACYNLASPVHPSREARSCIYSWITMAPVWRTRWEAPASCCCTSCSARLGAGSTAFQRRAALARTVRCWLA